MEGKGLCFEMLMIFATGEDEAKRVGVQYVGNWTFGVAGDGKTPVIGEE